MKCKHCGADIRHFSGRLYHEVGALIFPQYCKGNERPVAEGQATVGGGPLHEPNEEQK